MFENTIEKHPTIGVLIFAVILAAFTSAFWLGPCRDITRDMALERDAPGFAKATGVAISASVKHTGNRGTCEPVVVYDYTVEGRTYSGSTFQPFPVRPGEKSAAREIAHLTPGATLDVYYDPADPGRSTLRTDPGPRADGARTFLVMCAVVFGLMWSVLLLGLGSTILRRR
ncbi:MAG: DUF3592 domain-containing protein [Phycisphaerales bacterium]